MVLCAAFPEGAKPIFLSSPTQQIFECKADEDVTASRPYKLIKKEDILKDLFDRAAVCDFHPFKKIIEVGGQDYELESSIPTFQNHFLLN